MVSCVACGFSWETFPKSKATNVGFHVFPNDEHRRQVWIDFVKKPGWKLTHSSVLCSLHFDETCFDRTSLLKAKLLPTAIPTIEVDRLKCARLYNPASMYVTEDEDGITHEEKIHLHTPLPISINESLEDTSHAKLKSQITELQTNYVLKCRRIRSLQKVKRSQNKKIASLKSITAQLKKKNLLFEEEENNLLDQFGTNKDILATLFQKTQDEKKFEDTESVDDQIPPTSGKGSTELEEIIHNPKQMYSLPENLEKKMIRKKIRARRRLRKKSTDSQSINSEYDNGSTTSKENMIESQSDELECLTIIGDDNSSSSSKEERHFERSHDLSTSPVDRNSKVCNSDNESSSPEQNNHNSLSLSSSESDEDLKKTSARTTFGKRGRPRFFGDCSSDDMNHPARARICWNIAKETISELKLKVQTLQRQNRNLTQKVEYLRSLFLYLDENNFLNEYSQAAVKAVMSKNAKSSEKEN